MSSMTFQINDASTELGYPAVWVTITENANGTLTFTVTQEGGIIGDLRALYFDVSDETLLGSSLNVINADGTMTEVRIGNDTIKDLGDGSTIKGLTGSDGGYDVGIEIGTSGIGKDDVRSFTFTLDSTARDLTLADFGAVDFAARLTSVGIVGGTRADSSKILELTSLAADAKNDLEIVSENAVDTGNVLTNDATGGTSTVTSWSGGAVGDQVALASGVDIIGTVQLNADGTYTVDASAADELSAGESIVYNFNYDVKNQTEATSWSTDTGTFTVVINGTNDGPVAGDDAASTIENTTAATGSVLANDDDIDRLDTISVTGWSGGDLGGAVAIDNGEGATFQLNADGNYVLDASAANALSEGETITQTFTYTLSDNHNATDTATITVAVTGANDGPDAQDDEGGNVTEDQVLSGNVKGNDSDVDRQDTHSYALASEWDGPGELTFNEDGTWSYDSGDLADLNDGQVRELSFDYVMTDNHGATSTATVNFTVNGVSDPVEPPPPPPPPEEPEEPPVGDPTVDDSYPTFVKDISHAILVFATDAYDKANYTTAGDPADDGYYTVKFDFGTGVTSPDLDTDIDALLAWLVANDQYVDENTVLMGAQIKGGNIGTTNSYDDYWANDGGDLYNLVQIGTTSNGRPIYEWASTDEAIVDLDQVSQSQGGTLDQQYVYVNDDPFTIG